MKRIPFVLFSLVFCFSFLSAQITISNLSATVHQDNVLRYDIDFNLSNAAAAQVEYGFINNGDTVWNRSEVATTAVQQGIVIVGLRAATTYFFRVLAFNANTCKYSNTLSFSTGNLPANIGFSEMDSIYTLPGSSLKGYLLTNTSDFNPKRVVELFDRAGELVWYQEMPGNPSPSADAQCQHFALCSAQSVFFLECGRIWEIGFDGSIRANIDVHNINPNMYPHDAVIRNQAGNIVSLVAIIDTVDKSAVGGSSSAIVVAPGLIEVDSMGSLVWSWSAFDHYNALQSPNPGGYWTAKFGPAAIDWKHVNSLVQDASGNYMLTFRDENQIVLISGSSGAVLWTCGDHGDIEIMVPDSFAKPASTGIASATNFVTLDNASQDTVSRAIDWWIDWGYSIPTMMIDRSFVLPQAYFATEGGSTARLPNNNTLVASTKGGLFEFNLAGNQLWFGRLNASLDRAFYVSDLYARASLAYSGPTLFCLNDTANTLLASPAGGHWFGPGVSQGIFNATAAGAGLQTLSYKYGNDTLQVSVMVDSDPDCSTPIQEGQAWNLHFAAFPNPFVDHLQVCYTLSKKTEMHITLFALDGRRLATLFSGIQIPGDQNMKLDLSGLDLPQGAILLRMQAGDGAQSARLLIH
ncbi:MAG TPA: hypothetical protein ENJ82_03210 [Bacteroidetes bacterium]|nr:hypothetical protein [Bacteroidota bacterium]